MKDKMHLSGQLSAWSTRDLLQIMAVTNRTGSLDMEGELHGRVHFRYGRVTGAELTGAEEGEKGMDRQATIDVLYVLSRMEAGTFGVGAADGPETDGWSVDEILDEVEDLQSLESEILESGLLEAAAVRLVGRVDRPVTIESKDWRVLAPLVAAFTFSDLESRFGRGPAIRALHALDRLGVASSSASGDEEMEWLDGLAAEIATSPDGGSETESATSPDGGSETESATLDPEDVSSDKKTLQVENGAKKRTRRKAEVTGVAAPASTTLTEGVYDEIRRLRNRAKAE